MLLQTGVSEGPIHNYNRYLSAFLFQRGIYSVLLISGFFIITNLLMKIAGYSETAWDWELLFLIVDTIALVSMFYGVYAEKAAFIQPFVVLSVSLSSIVFTEKRRGLQQTNVI